MAEQDITIEQGATFDLAVTWLDEGGTPVPLAGYTARAQVRQDYDSAVSLEFEVDTGGDPGVIALHADAEDTAKVEFIERGVWDLELTDGDGEVVRPFRGKVACVRQVTHDS